MGMWAALGSLAIGCTATPSSSTEQDNPLKGDETHSDAGKDPADVSDQHIVTGVVGREGGRLCVGAGICLDVPSGALTDPVELSLNDAPELPEDLPEPYEFAIELLPDGLVLNKPATIEIPLGETYDPALAQTQVLLWSAPDWEWVEESEVEFDGTAGRAVIEHFSLRVTRTVCRRTTSADAWEVEDRDNTFSSQTAYVHASDRADVARFWPGPLTPALGTMHVSNSPEPITNQPARYSPVFRDFPNGVILYESAAIDPASSDNTMRIYTHHENTEGRTWRQAIVIRAGTQPFVYSFRRAQNVGNGAQCAGSAAARTLLNRTTTESATVTVPANGVGVVGGWTAIPNGQSISGYVDVTVAGTVARDASIVEVIVPTGRSLPTTWEAVNRLPRACYGQRLANAGWRDAHHRGRFAHTDRQGTWAYNIRDGVRAMVLGYGGSPNSAGGATPSQVAATPGDAENGADVTNHAGCLPAQSRTAGSNPAHNPANFGGSYAITIQLTNPLPSTETVDLVAINRADVYLGYTWRNQGFGRSVAENARELSQSLAVEAADCQHIGPGGCRNLAFVLERITLAGTPRPTDGTTAPTPTTITGTVTLTFQGGVSSPVWLELLPRRIVSVEDDRNSADGTDDDGIDMFRRAAPGRAEQQITDRLAAPRGRDELELRVRLNYPIPAIIPDGAVRIVRDGSPDPIPVSVTVDADVRPGDPPLTGTARPCTAQQFYSESRQTCLPIRKARLLIIRPLQDLVQEGRDQFHWLEITNTLKDLYRNDFAGQPLLPGTTVDDPSNATGTTRWKFRTPLPVSLEGGSGFRSEECTCGVAGLCGSVTIPVHAVSTSGSLSEYEGLVYDWSCFPPEQCSLPGGTGSSSSTYVTVSFPAPGPSCGGVSTVSPVVTVDILQGDSAIPIGSASTTVDASCAMGLGWCPLPY